jgi:GMP synthase-like glutamine amidotransferase
MNKILIVQFRTDQSLAQERRCMIDTFGPAVSQRVCFANAITEDLNAELLAGVSHVILGGSGEFFLGQGAGEGTWLPKIEAFIEEIYARDIPVFGICFGHQIILKHAGAQIQRNPDMEEVGTFLVTCNSLAATDELMETIPMSFDAIYAHKETPVDVPDSIVVLASSERVRAAVTRVAGRRAWSVMFHPDMNMMAVRERFAMFPHYAESPEKFAQALAAFREAPAAQEILRKFVTL